MDAVGSRAPYRSQNPLFYTCPKKNLVPLCSKNIFATGLFILRDVICYASVPGLMARRESPRTKDSR
jgi:hypothetical protein